MTRHCSQIDLIRILQTQARDFRKRLFTIREIALLGGVTPPAAGMLLLRAGKKGIVLRIGRLWINRLDPPDLKEVAAALLKASYLSFESALYHHGVISQSPRGALTVATAERPREVGTPFGLIRFIHLKRSLFFGYDADRIAPPEKAWLDLVYIRGRRGRGGRVLTEQCYPERLNRKRLAEWVGRFPPWVGRLSRELLAGC